MEDGVSDNSVVSAARSASGATPEAEPQNNKRVSHSEGTDAFGMSDRPCAFWHPGLPSCVVDYSKSRKVRSQRILVVGTIQSRFGVVGANHCTCPSAKRQLMP